MLFSSIIFLYLFLPVAVLIYYLTPKKGRNSILLMESLVFYGWGEPKWILVMLLEILWGYMAGLLIAKFREEAPGKVILGVSLGVELLVLGYFKYTDFLLKTYAGVTGAAVELLYVVLPIGISFYTFQLMSYQIDVYRGSVRPQRNLLTLGTYVAMFPQLIAGPILRYKDVEQQLRNREYSFDKAAVGVRRFLMGLGKKVLLANTLGELCDTFRDSGDLSVSYYWLYAISFTLHIYYDFSGYSDMAIGLGKIFGFDFLENFDHPYISRSITEFWRRWHMSLGRWFRDYVYIPLGGSRTKKSRWVKNVLLVWFLTGLWHGAAWQFILWGMWYGVLLLVEKRFFLSRLQRTRVAGRIYVLLAVVFGFVLFNARSLSEAGNDIRCMLGFGHLPLMSRECLYYLRSYGVILIAAILGATPVLEQLSAKIRKLAWGNYVLCIAEPMAAFLLLLVATAYLVDGSFNPFLYFRF